MALPWIPGETPELHLSLLSVQGHLLSPFGQQPPLKKFVSKWKLRTETPTAMPILTSGVSGPTGPEEEVWQTQSLAPNTCHTECSAFLCSSDFCADCGEGICGELIQSGALRQFA